MTAIITPETIAAILRQSQKKNYRQLSRYKPGTVFSFNGEYFVYVGVKNVRGVKHPVAVCVENRRHYRFSKNDFNLIR